MESCLKFIERVYSVFGFNYSLTLSTRPEHYMGKIEDWNQAEEGLKTTLQNLGRSWTINVGDGAFYGPKIDIIVKDALGRDHQTAIIQLDFQLPQRFGLKYTDSDGQEKTPVIIHRAILGSVERMFGILIEHTGGKWPLWLSPRQVCVLPVSNEVRHHSIPTLPAAFFSQSSRSSQFEGAAESVLAQLKDAGFAVEMDSSEETLNKRIRNAQLIGFNFIAVVGAKERDSNTVSVRERQQGEEAAKQSVLPVSDFIAQLKSLKTSFK